MSTSFLNKKIPTMLGLLLLGIAVFATSYLAHTGVILFGGAAPTDNPEDVRITNVSNTSFTVTYKTEAKVIGTISLINNASTQTVLDERDQQSGIPKLYNLHSISLHTLTPNTLYQFSITSGTTTYQNNGNPFSAKTATFAVNTPTNTPPLTGKLLDVNGNSPSEALVFVTTNGGQSLSTFANQNGIYILPLNAMLTSDFSQPVTLTPQSVMQVLATDGSSTSQAQVLISGANPVPLITLSNSYNFVVNATPIASTAASLGFPPFPQTTTLTATPIIITPKKDEGFTDAQPQFSGTALPNQTVTIEIHSDAVISATTTANSSGSWTYRPSTPLPPGQHVLSITTKNAAGILQTIQQSFTVYASGTQLNQSPSPSPSVSPAPSVASPTVTPTPTTSVLSPTLVPTKIPTIAPTVFVPTKITPRPTLPPTGSNSLIVSSVLGIVTAIVGVVLFVLTKGASL